MQLDDENDDDNASPQFKSVVDDGKNYLPLLANVRAASIVLSSLLWTFVYEHEIHPFLTEDAVSVDCDKGECKATPCCDIDDFNWFKLIKILCWLS